uniref:Insulin-like domain-containing protein n=1 Tax=Timema genevievae TaxID=629358 RepID=A0A7R9PP11_TIMGE|nr:unnamed protein product [Timema genevievae]
MSRLCALVMVALVCLCVVTARKAEDDPQLPRMIRACGRALSITLYRLCNHQYNSVEQTRITTGEGLNQLELPPPFPVCAPLFVTRSITTGPRGRLDLNHTEVKQIGDESSELTPKTTLHKRRTRRSIFNECCVKSCSVSEMKEYCA